MAASKSSPGPVLYAFIFIVSVMAAVLLLKDYSGPESLPAQLKTHDPPPDRVAALEKEIIGLKQSIEGYRQLVLAYYGNTRSSWVIAELKEKGLADPVKDLRADLKRHPELIPHKGTLGGTMGFYFPNKIHVLSSQWVLAYFEDGHNGGYVLLKFAVTDKGLISWKTVDSFLD